jgi:hypothetical protein
MTKERKVTGSRAGWFLMDGRPHIYRNALAQPSAAPQKCVSIPNAARS